jgi:hypothetical protein
MSVLRSVADLEDPDLIAEEIACDLAAALEQGAAIVTDLRAEERTEYKNAG